MERSLDVLRERLKTEAPKHAGEAFEEHGEQIFEALGVMYQCRNLARESGLLALEEVVDSWEEGKGLAEDVPLRKLLIYLTQKIVDADDLDDVEEEVLNQAVESGCPGSEWYVMDLYLTGIKNIHGGTGSEDFYHILAAMVPERWLEDYHGHFQTIIEKWKGEEQASSEEGLKKRLRRESDVRTAFNRIFGEMAPERSRYIFKQLDDKILAKGICSAAEPVRNRLLEYMESGQRESVLREMGGYQYGCLEDILDAMDRMLIVAGLT